MRRVRRTPGLWLYAALAVAGLLLTALAAREAWLLSRAPDVGVDVGTGGLVLAADDRWPAIAPGDRVVAVDGRAIDGQTDWMRAQRRVDAGRVSLTIAAPDGARSEQAAPTRELSAPHRLALWVRVATGALLIALGLLAFLLRPGERATWLLLAASWSIGAWMLGETVPALLVPTLAIAMPLAGSATALFLWSFPRQLSAIRGGWAPWLLGGGAIALIVAQLVSRIATGSWDGRASWWPPLHLARYGWLALTTAVALVGVARQYRVSRRSPDPADEARVRGLLLGILLGLTLPLAWSILRNLASVPTPRFAAYYNSAPLLLFIGTCAYIAVRHNALAIDRFTAAVTGYAITVFFAGLLFASLLVGLPLLLGGGGIEASPPVLVALTAAVFAGSAPVYRWLRRRIDRRFFRHSDASARMQRALRRLLDAARAPTTDQGVQAALRVVRALPSDRAELWTTADDGHELARFARSGAPIQDAADRIDRDGPLARAIADRLDGGVEGLAPRALPPAAQDELWSLGLAMVAPVSAHGSPIGFLAAERKRSGGAFTAADLTFLTIVAGQIGLMLERDDGVDRSVGRYRIERRLGVGGMAEVYLAWQLGPGGFERKVALKRPLPGVALEASAIEMFLDEARVSAQLHHPNIAEVYEVGEDDGAYFLAMEYVDGLSLRALQRSTDGAVRALPLPAATRVAREILRALEHAHGASDGRGQPLELVHRDVTPSNVILARDGAVKLVDFGIARAATQLHTTRAGTVRGTLAYMSPEQAAGRRIDHRTDLYAVGALLYEMVTGRRAFPTGPLSRPWRRDEPEAAAPAELAPADGKTATTRMSQGVPELPVAGRPTPTGVDPDLDDLFFRAVAHDPNDRFQSAREMLDALEEVVASTGVAGDDELGALVCEVTGRAQSS